MSTHRSTWKRRERDAARIFGAFRQPLSGLGGRPTGSDSTHARLYVECKTRASSAVRNLWEITRDKARKEGKMPILASYAQGKPGGLLVIHQDDRAAVATEWAGPTASAAAPSATHVAPLGRPPPKRRPVPRPRRVTPGAQPDAPVP